MGLQSQLSDVSSESIPILVIAIIANCVSYFRSILFYLLQSVGISRPDSDQIDDGICDALNLNLGLSYKYDTLREDGGCGSGTDCVVCLNRLSDGDQVRKLACGHVFHKECFDGWLDHLNFNCPLCRSPLVTEERVQLTEKRVSGDILTWFSLR
ncbi:hypothetical protein LguiB_025167 [Lonicera macranthoides]